MIDCVYRKLYPEDIRLVVDMNLNYREGFICRKNAELFLQNPANWIFAAVDGKKIIGFAYGYELNRLNDIGNMLYIHEVGVMKKNQRQGVGFSLMTELMKVSKTKGICRLFLSAHQNNIGANALYKKLGGEVSPDSKGNDTCYHFQIK